MTRTGAVDHCIKEAPEQAEAYEEEIPMKRMGMPEEQANAVVWLCSDKASFITGVNSPVDGGETSQ